MSVARRQGPAWAFLVSSSSIPATRLSIRMTRPVEGGPQESRKTSTASTLAP